MPPTLQNKINQHHNFWQGKGPCLIFIPTPELGTLDPATEALFKYDTDNYKERFYSPQKMWEAEIRRARQVLDWPTDGIPTIRPNLGTIFIPAMAGQKFQILENQMPVACDTLSLDTIRHIDMDVILNSDMMKRAEEFYLFHAKEGDEEIVPYLPDTQGIFDLTHLMYGNDIFMDMVLEESIPHVKSIMTVCSDLFVNVSFHLKSVLKEKNTSMIHGHGTPQGLYFPTAGVRMSEDSATMISPQMIDEFVIPHIIKASEPFGGVFFHFCGKHDQLFEKVCQLDCVKAIDLGNPGDYDLEKLFKICADTGTVFYSRVAPELNEDWESYIKRIALVQNKTGARCVLRTLIHPHNRKKCADMRELWHNLTM